MRNEKSAMFANPVTERMAGFVRGIGIDVHAESLSDGTFLPGLDIRHGAILVDEDRLAYPGDLLHEAGHIAVAPPEQRNEPTITPNDGDEMATLAWSYAAACHLGLQADVVFHPHGYKGGSQALIDAFTSAGSMGPGMPLLAYYGMTVEEKFAAERGVEPYPHMLRWVR
jgi:hypothetical protein